MEQKLIKALEDIQFEGALKDLNVLTESLKEGPRNVQYTELVHYLTKELKTLCNIDEEVNVISTPEDSVSFLMELSSFLKELGCPHESLTQGHISDRLSTNEDRILLLDYLISELMAARMMKDSKPDKKIELKLQESRQAFHLRRMLITLRFPKPPANISVQTLFKKVNPTVENLIKNSPGDVLGTPISNFTLTDKEWDALEKVQKDLHAEYMIRRQMLLKRLDCTIQSFQWSDKMKGKDDLIEKTYAEKRKMLKVEPDVTIADLLAAREDIAIIEKTSSAAVRRNTQTSVNKVIIGKVPDRGGRTSEQAPPPPEMPSWQQRQPGPSGGGPGNSRGRGRGDFNRNQQNSGRGYENQQHYNQRDNNYQQKDSYQQRDNNYQQRDNNYQQRDNNYQQDYQQRGGNNYHRGGGNYYQDNVRGRNSSGSDYQTEPKRPKTFDSFQSNKVTYADQYVQESEHNSHYQPRGGRGRGRSNYNRGGRGNQNYY